MEKLIILFILASLSQNQINSNDADNQAEEVQEFVYWEAFSETFDKTADYWKAESEALKAENIAEERTGIEEWLSQNEDITSELDIEEECKFDSC